MFRLKRHNIVKVVDSEHKAKKLISEGYTLTSQPSFVNAVTAEPKPLTSENGKGDERFDCPYCNKDYGSKSALNSHIKDKHPETLEE